MGATDMAVSWILDTRLEDMPPETRQASRDASFDGIGCMLAGAVQPHGRMIVEYVQRLGGPREAAVVGSNVRTSAAQAALANGTLGHALDYDDHGQVSHAAAILMGALLPLGERLGASGKQVVEADVIGRELGHALSQEYDNTGGFHRMAVFGRIAAVAAAAKLLQLDARQTTMALGIVGTMASGVNHSHGSMSKPLHGGLAARDGIMAAEMAAMGWTAGDRTLEHPDGFLAAFCGLDINPNGRLKDLGRPFKTHELVGIKKYPCGAGNHPQIDGLLSLMQAHGFTGEDVEEVEIVQSYDSHYIAVRQPRNGLEGKFSAMFTAAATLVDGRVDIETFTDEYVKDPRIVAMMERVRLYVLDKWEVGLDRAERKWPSGSTGNTGRGVTVRLKVGRVLQTAIRPPDVLGNAKNPWGWDNIRAKFEANASLALPEDQVREAVRTWSDIEGIGSVRDAVACLVPRA
jgi:2-methylcitrate dehydratase PrpD